MRKIIQDRIFKVESQYVGECIDLPVVTQGKTLDEAFENLKEAIVLYLEGENPAEFDLAPEPSNPRELRNPHAQSYQELSVNPGVRYSQSL